MLLQGCVLRRRVFYGVEDVKRICPVLWIAKVTFDPMTAKHRRKHDATLQEQTGRYLRKAAIPPVSLDVRRPRSRATAARRAPALARPHALPYNRRAFLPEGEPL